MAGDLRRYGFDEGCFTPGTLTDRDNPYTDFKLAYRKIDGRKVIINGLLNNQAVYLFVSRKSLQKNSWSTFTRNFQ
jgi:hypothetical protein